MPVGLRKSDRDQAVRLVTSGTSLWRESLNVVLPLVVVLSILPMLFVAYMYRGMLGPELFGSAWEYFMSTFIGGTTAVTPLNGNASFLTAINMVNIVINYVLTPFLWAGVAHALCYRWLGRKPDMNFTLTTLREYWKRILLTGVVASFALSILGVFVSLIRAAGGVVVAITWWVPVLGSALSVVVFVLSLIANLALSAVTLAIFVFVMCVLMGESATGTLVAMRVWTFLCSGRAVWRGLITIFAADLAFSLAISAICGLLVWFGLGWAAALAIFFTAQAMTNSWLASLAVSLYKGLNDAQGGADTYIEVDAVEVE